LAVALVLAALVALGLLICLVTLAFLGLGTLFTHFFALTLFQATTVTLLGAITFMLLLDLVRALISAARGAEYEGWEEEDEEDWYAEDWDEDLDEDWDEALDEKEQQPGISFLPTSHARENEPEEDVYAGVGRNDPCPCGSGRKFKYCHGRIGRR